jgi:Flp pilus assembly protein TadB
MESYIEESLVVALAVALMMRWRWRRRRRDRRERMIRKLRLILDESPEVAATPKI